jgi:asparagine synthase (glutamine-hydrolysing)
MCGIVGFSGQFSGDALRQASACISHRGPDDSGIYFDGSTAGLAFRRLSIIDLTPSGAQPMASPDGKVVVVFNGEIYNYRELRTELRNRGVSFAGSSDTEVLLQLYLTDGEAMLRRLKGIFAFAIWDGRDRSLFVARDGIGVKPLYYASTERGFVFASELKAILHLIPEERELDPMSIHRYLMFMWCPGDGTPVRAVRKLSPGEAMRVRDGRIERRWKWYELPFFDTRVRDATVESAASDTVEHLRTAVHRQLVSDVPVGSFLSGGLDSSAVVAFAREQIPDLRCFSIEALGEPEGGSTDDLPYARRVARHLGVELDVVRIDASDMAQDLERMVWQLDEPLSDPAALNVLYISQLARERGIKVLLSGAGGDDLFSGYRRHVALEYEPYWRWLPRSVRERVDHVAGHLDQQNAFARRVGKLFNGADLDGDAHLANYFRWIRESEVLALYTPALRAHVIHEAVDQPMIDFLKPLPAETSSLNRMLALEQRFFLADHNLTYTDKMSMAVGVEVRVPFLDLELVQYAATLPDRLKQHRGQSKWILKKAMEPFLPRDVIYRPKTGFGAPLRRWMRRELRPLVGDLLSAESLKRRGLFDADAVHRLIARNDAGEVDAAYMLLALLCTEIWCRRFVDGPPAIPEWPPLRIVSSRPTTSVSQTSFPRRPVPQLAGEYRICTSCVMDTSDPKIVFDSEGRCDHCATFYSDILPNWHTDQRGKIELESLVRRIRASAGRREYDCIIGASGGVDSSYLTYIAKEEFNLKPLVFHVDTGWNSQEAVNNIERLVDGLGLELFTEVVDWEKMRDLQLAFFKAGVPHIDVPQDHAIFAAMYKFADRQGIKYILTGANYSTECVRNPIDWMYYQSDATQLRDIHARFGTGDLGSFPTTDVLWHKLYLPVVKGIGVVRPLNYVPYRKADAIAHLSQALGWQPYPQKHFESRFTAFYEGFWLYHKFGYDVRRVQFSSLILTGQMSRNDAIAALKEPPLDEATASREFSFVASKLRISTDELREYLYAPNHTYRDYRSRATLYGIGARASRLFGLERGGKR